MKPKIIFSDFDGTLTLKQALTPVFFDILNLAEENNIPFIIVTGRSKSWAHFFLSHFPYIQHAITEGGGVLSTGEPLGHRTIIKDQLLIDSSEVKRLEEIVIKFKKEFPEVPFSADSSGRETDRAIELYYLESHMKTFRKVKDFLRENNVNFSVSNVHLNFWCGEISKAHSVEYFLKEKIKANADECIYFGDSLNDESMFKHFKHTVGVSNIIKVQNQLESLPSTILKGDENEGVYGVYNYLKDALK